MKFRYLLTLTIFSTITFSQDVNPFFSDPNQQLEFEQKLIYINEVEDKRQYISGGGDVFNWWSLLLDTEPIYKTAPITTSFYYDYTFEIIRNGIVLNEIEFLQFIGLTDLADNIIKDYQNKFTQYQNDMDKWESDKYYYKIEKPNVPLFLGGFSSAIIGLVIVNNDQESETLGFVFMGCGVAGVVAGLITPQKVRYEYPKPIEPVLKQHLTNDQIKSIAESHNRKVFRTILEKNNQD